MPKPARNIQVVCENHAPKADGKWADKPPSFFKGKWVKKAFDVAKYDDFKRTAAEFKKYTGNDIPKVEHMWIKVTGTKDGKLVGTLANKSLFPGGPQFGQTAEVSLDEISQVSDTAD